MEKSSLLKSVDSIFFFPGRFVLMTAFPLVPWERGYSIDVGLPNGALAYGHDPRASKERDRQVQRFVNCPHLGSANSIGDTSVRQRSEHSSHTSPASLGSCDGLSLLDTRRLISGFASSDSLGLSGSELYTVKCAATVKTW